MAESWGRDLKPLVDGLFYEIFGTILRYHNFKNEIGAWKTTEQKDESNKLTVLLIPLTVDCCVSFEDDVLVERPAMYWSV